MNGSRFFGEFRPDIYVVPSKVAALMTGLSKHLNMKKQIVAAAAYTKDLLGMSPATAEAIIANCQVQIELTPASAQQSGPRYGDAAEILDYLEVVHVFIRRPYPSGQALHQTGQANRSNYSSAGFPDEELFEELARRV